ncbi:hypothetical protein [Clostridium sp. UBA4548]|uniref:hypothetical protein n=1 Tax=Clostridium sp. UBA4548 TaxID=1946361 RepID=UPI0025C02B8D|nr:hypothetical protein [Clostridium sp. UBA4548]
MNLDRNELIGENAFSIDGIISIPNGIDQEEFFDNLIEYLQDKGAYFFGFTETLQGEAMKEGRLKELLTVNGIQEFKEDEI